MSLLSCLLQLPSNDISVGKRGVFHLVTKTIWDDSGTYLRLSNYPSVLKLQRGQ